MWGNKSSRVKWARQMMTKFQWKFDDNNNNKNNDDVGGGGDGCLVVFIGKKETMWHNTSTHINADHLQ